ncbi:MAG TPA: ATP-binding protein [Dehalococcoidia bacterium]|nr:ATP-binding protein [Dehalococcoidia bacterium]
MDPRLAIIGERFKDIKRLIAVAGGKGGIGKSMIASALALILSDLGYRVGLLDLDFCGPSTHAILGIDGVYPEEDKGVVPPQVHGIKFLSIVYYAGDNPSPLRGIDISNAMIELLAITRWGSLDFLIIDMPPGIGDTALDTVRLIKGVEFLVITTPSKVALETVGKTLRILKEMSVPIIGVIENMKMAESSYVREQITKFDVLFGGEIAFDRELEDSVGDAVRLLETDFAQNLRQIVLSTPAFKPQDGG